MGGQRDLEDSLLLFDNILEVFLRQEVDGPPQGEQLEFVPCGQKLDNSRNSINAGVRLCADKRLHSPHS